ncbi:integrase core domain-containing protein [Pseudoduganella sp. R-32]|uniref:integrase core domain-containing protein n=1 Tax=Pseudoduganella sp. R-32 TaxID=3404061 RepID=UPI003CFB8827
MPDKRAGTILRHLLRAISQYGMPRAIRTDNEAIFHSLLFRTTLKFLGVRQQFSQPGMPWQNGRIERLFGTLKEKLDQLTVEDLPALRLSMHEFGFWYNQVRPHQHLNGRTPMEAWRGIDPHRQRPKCAYLFEAWDGLLKGVWLRH